jgi:hypothetical protein
MSWLARSFTASREATYGSGMKRAAGGLVLVMVKVAYSSYAAPMSTHQAGSGFEEDDV